MTDLIIIQARMNSTRLPGKALADINGKTALQHVIQRAQQANIAPIVVATTNLPEDDPIEHHVNQLGIACHRGHPTDLLTRYTDTADHYGPTENIIRITADCPLLNTNLLQQVHHKIRHEHYDYVGVTNAPDGTHQEAFTTNTLRITNILARTHQDREHVVTYILKRPDMFRHGWINANLQGEPCTLDTPEDLERIRRMAT